MKKKFGKSSKNCGIKNSFESIFFGQESLKKNNLHVKFQIFRFPFFQKPCKTFTKKIDNVVIFSVDQRIRRPFSNNQQHN